MKSKLFTLIAVLMVFSMLLAACAPAPAPTAAPAAPAEPAKKVVKVVNLINGVLGDKSFFDSAQRGMVKSKDEFGLQVKTIEAGIDPAKWQPALEDAAANEDYDIMILGTYQMSEFLQKVAPKYPDKKFIIYDVSVDYTACKCGNVYSMTYKQNEGSYIAGVWAGLMTKSKIIGAVGGQDIPVINDFIVGYKQGAKANGVEDSKVLVQYAGSWNDPAKGKEIALAMYQQGADIVFQVAGGTGVGIFQAAKEAGKLAIGVDSDQYMIIKDTDPEQAKVIATSMMKNVDNSIYRAMKMYLAGTLPFGKAEALGLAEGGIGLAKNDYYKSLTSADIQKAVEQAEQDVSSGKVKVDTAFK
jgi:basic membrane protein A and related proteins